MKMPPVFLPALAAAFLLLAAPGMRAAGDIKPTPAPAWQLKDVDGRVVSSDQFRNQVVVLDFWATWCGPCRAEIPGYGALQKKYAADGLAVVGVSLDQAGPGVVKKFIAEEKIGYQIVMADDQIVGAFGGVEAIPTTFIIDRSGMIRYRKVGSMPPGDFEEVLKRFLK
jgi:peroxiredoxin